MKTKKLFFAVTAMAIALTLTMALQAAGADKKDPEKQAKAKLKEYKKEGWKISGGSRTLEVALLEHYAKLTKSENKELIGAVQQCQSINVCKQWAQSNAANSYATLAGSKVAGNLGSLLKGKFNKPQEEIDLFVAAYKNRVKAEVSGAMTESYSIVKDNGKKGKEYQTIFIVNENEAREARKRAMEGSVSSEIKTAEGELREIFEMADEDFDLEEM